jgi:hypothetical protein
MENLCMTLKISRLLILVFVASSFQACAVFRAAGDTIEAIGEGTAKVIGGVASGTATVIGGTGRAISRAANGSVSQTVSETESEFRF